MELAKTMGSVLLIYGVAAFLEIIGSFAFWSILRLGKPLWWAIPGSIALLLFAILLTRTDTDFAGRAYAAYGGIYIASSLLWMWLVEGNMPDLWDIIGVGFCIVGVFIIILPKHA